MLNQTSIVSPIAIGDKIVLRRNHCKLFSSSSKIRIRWRQNIVMKMKRLKSVVEHLK
jgi:hypothetical protein